MRFLRQRNTTPSSHSLHVLEKVPSAAKTEEAIAEATEQLNKLIPPERRNTPKIKTAVCIGKPYQKIVQFAQEQQIELLTMGVRGRGALDLAVFGSTTYRVMQLESCARSYRPSVIRVLRSGFLYPSGERRLRSADFFGSSCRCPPTLIAVVARRATTKPTIMRKEITKAKTTYCAIPFADSSSPWRTGKGAVSGAAGRVRPRRTTSARPRRCGRGGRDSGSRVAISHLTHIYKDACGLAQAKGLPSLIYHEPAIEVKFKVHAWGSGHDENFDHTGTYVIDAFRMSTLNSDSFLYILS